MIPKSILHADVMSALHEIDRNGVPAGRQSKKFHLLHGGKQYPPKYVLTLACKSRTGFELDSGTFNGGVEANDFLRHLGFVVGTGVSKTPPPKVTPPMVSRPPASRPVTSISVKHTERCKDCKAAVERLLRLLYGPVERNPKIDVPAFPEAYDATQRPALEKVYSALQAQRGFKSFVLSDTLPRCDFHVGVLDCLVEFDESQHFTKSRGTALSMYPNSLPLGFDRPTWLRLCDKIDSRDNTPPFRDEQRAWYDALRDFLPFTKGMLPTIRLWAEEYKWCGFKSDRTEDVETFRQILGERASFWSIEFDVPEGARLARLTVDGDWRGELGLARKLLRDVCSKWPGDCHVLCLSTCGAFLRMEWPSGVLEQERNFTPSAEAMKEMDTSARAVSDSLLSGGIREELKKRADFLTIGIDTEKSKISMTSNWIREPHAELVYVVNLKTGQTHFTGKSYPTLRQEPGLLRVTHLGSHFVQMNEATAIVLGCHDLTIFNRRSDGVVKNPERIAVKEQFKALCDAKKPSIVLHHPHTTIKVSTWRDAWGGIRRRVPTLRSFLGTGCYSHQDDWPNRDPRSEVLESTKSPDVLDIIVQMAGCPS